jgi:hypothetical protein
MSLAGLVIMSAASLAATVEPVAPADAPVLLAQVEVRRNTIIRIRPAAPSRPVKYKEKGAPKCLAWSQMAGAIISSSSTIDVIVKGGTRYRVKLEKSCQAIDFYSGFYVKATKDGRVCEDRDMIHSRSGGECGISKFKTLVPDD